MEKIAVFVDVQNIYYTCKQAYGRSFNYRALFKMLNQQAQVEYAFAYAIAPADDGQVKFQDALRHIGFEVKLKPYIQRSDGSAKGDWDVGITIDVLDYAEHVDKVILLSGDGDFDLLMAKVAQKYACDTQVISVAALTAKSLLDVIGSHIPIESNLLL
ncbi:NYN domain-containing protein [Shewanella sp. 10N.7]|uniref:LabA-like NYN domain-containing protein n=1 Tax=Shewanella sp. 10N.7 TaxID=2885093 RepID=UPI001E5FAB56|nr:NYN domain-containing protein [Shewanella sp. 10N.7]MCC4832197.1 NYN domain-containing protein [Shewanella sp. 10N.7]